MMSEAESALVQEGYDAYFDGVTFSNYDTYSTAARLWEKGWNIACQEELDS